MGLVQKLIPTSQYATKCPYGMRPKGVTIHNTANDATAQNERDNLARPDNTAEVSFHIAVDDKEAILCIPLERNAWHAGDGATGPGNSSYIAMEICHSLSGGPKFIAAEKRAAKETAALLKTYGWTINNVKKHQDFSGKYCPHRTLDMGWQRFLAMVQAELNLLNKPAAAAPVDNLYRVRKSWDDAKTQLGAFKVLKTAVDLCNRNKGYAVFDSKGDKIYPVDAAEHTKDEVIIKEYPESGKFTCTADKIYFRNKPIVTGSNPVQGSYTKGEHVIYDRVVITNKYVYISWVSASIGVRRYMPYWDKLADPVGNKKWGYCI